MEDDSTGPSDSGVEGAIAAVVVAAIFPTCSQYASRTSNAELNSPGADPPEAAVIYPSMAIYSYLNSKYKKERNIIKGSKTLVNSKGSRYS